MENFFDRLHKLIDIETGGKHTKFAKKAGIPASTFQSYLGQRVPKPEHLIRISETFNINIDWLLTGKGNPYRKKDGEENNRAPDGMGPLDADPVISDLLENARKILKSGNKAAYDALERGIRYFSLAAETEKRFRSLEDRISQMEESVTTFSETTIRKDEDPDPKEALIKKKGD